MKTVAPFRAEEDPSLSDEHQLDTVGPQPEYLDGSRVGQDRVDEHLRLQDTMSAAHSHVTDAVWATTDIYASPARGSAMNCRRWSAVS
jgi:hypothetical protein